MSLTDIEIRRAIPSDAEKIASAEKIIFTDPWSERDIFSSICDEGSMCYTALSDGEVVAYIIGKIIAPEGEIYRIATLPSKRREGISRRLLDFAIKNEMACGLEVVFLEVREKNLPARSLYTSYGFTETGIRNKYYKNPCDNAILMTYRRSADL